MEKILNNQENLQTTEEKVNAIRKHNVYLFVADEIYQNHKYLQEIKGIFSSKDLTIETLKSLK